ncbi:hypothetical protein RHMOL_Rhmol08G0193600 [Rhododendron molle]|uniref:Uncharacterized protein n=1 Tax=Rhododendron molle TaxID=49168 RepID=A0ACC0MS30_RHOML|nr:hypothetical protein RHMOL_Rhmol08G0193600 [Rhododendron molle]
MHMIKTWLVYIEREMRIGSPSPQLTLSLSRALSLSETMNGEGRRRGGGGGDRRDLRLSKQQKLILTAEEQLESKLGFDLFSEGDRRLG